MDLHQAQSQCAVDLGVVLTLQRGPADLLGLAEVPRRQKARGEVCQRRIAQSFGSFREVRDNARRKELKGTSQEFRCDGRRPGPGLACRGAQPLDGGHVAGHRTPDHVLGHVFRGQSRLCEDRGRRLVQRVANRLRHPGVEGLADQVVVEGEEPALGAEDARLCGGSDVWRQQCRRPVAHRGKVVSRSTRCLG